MKLSPILAVFCLLAVVGPVEGLGYTTQDAPADRTQSRTGSREQDEATLRGLVAAFTKAFNAGDAKAISALFSEDARMVTLGGRAVEGREAIEKLFAASFEENPGQTIDVKTESLRFLGPDAAIEEGTATITTPGPRGARQSRPKARATRPPMSDARASGSRTASVTSRPYLPRSQSLERGSRSSNGWSANGSTRATKERSTRHAAGPNTRPSSSDRSSSRSAGSRRCRARS